MMSLTQRRLLVASVALASAAAAEAEAVRRRKAAEALHRKPDPLTARERAEREAASGEMG